MSNGSSSPNISSFSPSWLLSRPRSSRQDYWRSRLIKLFNSTYYGFSHYCFQISVTSSKFNTLSRNRQFECAVCIFIEFDEIIGISKSYLTSIIHINSTSRIIYRFFDSRIYGIFCNIESANSSIKCNKITNTYLGSRNSFCSDNASVQTVRISLLRRGRYTIGIELII